MLVDVIDNKIYPIINSLIGLHSIILINRLIVTVLDVVATYNKFF